MNIKPAYNHAKSWNDTKSIERMESSSKSRDVHQAEIENHLREMSIRFERSPGQSTIQAWAKDLAEMGYKHTLVAQICKTIPYKMDKHPTLNDIMALIKPHLAQESFSVDELTDLSNRIHEHVKAKFLSLQPQTALDQMVKLYMTRIVPDCEHFSSRHKEMMVLNDWLRSYFKKGEDILKQGLISNEQFKNNNLDYFINPLKRYAKDNNL